MARRVVHHERGRPVLRSGLWELVLFTFRLRQRIRVTGQSMEPALFEGDHVLIEPRSRATEGEIVLCRHPYVRTTQIIKRVTETTPEGMFLEGDNPDQSTDSASFGVVPWALLIGRVSSKM